MMKYIFTFLSICFSSSCFAQNLSVLSTEERKFLVEMLQASLAQFDSSIANLTEAQFNFRPSKKEWTIAECIEHVCLAELQFPQIVKEELAKPANPTQRKEIKITNEKIAKRLKFRGFKANAPEIFKPSGRFVTVEEAISTFRNQRLKTIDYVNVTNDDLRNHFWTHRATGIIDLYQTLILMSAHLERHLAQIEEVKSDKKYPKN
jgi:hypothetical protein